MEEQEDATKEALNCGALTQLHSSPGGKEAAAVSLPLGIAGDDGHRSQDGVNPGE